MAKVYGVPTEAKAVGTEGWLAVNCSNFVGLEASGGLAASASSKSRKSSPVATGKNLSELIAMSVSLPSGRWNLMAMPCGLASADPSGIFGIPVESENRTVARIELPLNNTARLSSAASGEALKLPSANAFGVIGTKSRMDTKYLVHCVNELLLDRLILSPDDCNPC